MNNIILVGFSTGGGEVARYIGRHGSKRVAKLGLISNAIWRWAVAAGLAPPACIFTS